MTTERFSFKELMKTRDTKVSKDKRGKEKEVYISISEKTEELRKLLHEQVTNNKSKRKGKKNAEIIETLQLERQLIEKYPHTKSVEKDIILNGLAGRIRNL